MYIVHCTLFQRIPLTYNVQCKSTLYIVYSLLYTLGKCILYTVQCTLYTVQCTEYSQEHPSRCTMYNVHCTVYRVLYCTSNIDVTTRIQRNQHSCRDIYSLYSVHCILNIVTQYVLRMSYVACDKSSSVL